VCVGLVLLTDGTSLNVFSYIKGKTGPSEFGCYQLAGFKISGMTGCFMIMTPFQNTVMEGVDVGNIHASLICKYSSFNCQ